MIDQDYLDFCETLWNVWLANKLELSDEVSRRFQLEHAPEPYLRFGDGTKPLYVLLTNPGKGLPHQKRSAVTARSAPINSEMSYYTASRNLADYYEDTLKSGAGLRIKAMLDLMEMLEFDCIVQFECVPFHSRSLPGKRRIPRLVEDSTILREYACVLTNALKNISVLAISAVSSSKSIARHSVAERESPWLAWQASLMGVRSQRLKLVDLSWKGGKVTRAFLHDRIAENVRGFVLTMGSNSMPDSCGRKVLARAFKRAMGIQT